MALVLLTLTVALGIVNHRRDALEGVPRFVVQAVHRNLSLLAVAFVAIHVVTTLLDSFAPVRLLDAVIPFISAYRPVWLGLGAVAFDLLVAVLVTSLLRRQFGLRAWRGVHWLSYGSWPVALVHALGTGSDAAHSWMLVIAVGCLLVVLAAVVARIADGWPEHRRTRLGAVVASAAVPIGLIIWLPGGPLAPGWAKRAGTPAALLPHTTASAGAAASGGGTPGTGTATGAGAATGGFTASVSGSSAEGQDTVGLSVVDIHLHVSGQSLSRLRVRIAGEPLPGGGLEMRGGEVWLGSAANPDRYRGVVTGLSGSEISASLSGSPALQLLLRLQIAPGSGAVNGTVTARRA